MINFLNNLIEKNKKKSDDSQLKVINTKSKLRKVF